MTTRRRIADRLALDASIQAETERGPVRETRALLERVSFTSREWDQAVAALAADFERWWPAAGRAVDSRQRNAVS